MEIVLKFFATTEYQILFILPFVVMTVATLAMRLVLPTADNAHQSGRMAAYDDLHREAYVSAIIAAAVTVIWYPRLRPSFRVSVTCIVVVLLSQAIKQRTARGRW